MKRQMTDDVARAMTCKYRMGFGELHDLCGIVFEDEAENCGESIAIGSIMAQEQSGLIGPCRHFGRWRIQQPAMFPQKRKHISATEQIWPRQRIRWFRRVHEASLAVS